MSSVETVQTNLPPVNAATLKVSGTALAERARLATSSGRPLAITLNPVDTVEISETARERDEQSHSIKVQRVKQELADGTYLDPEKWDRALDRLLADIDRAE